jgi:hypothetical protein
MPLCTVIRRAIDAVRVLPFKAAVSVAVWSDAIVPAVAVKLAVVDPAATATDPGTVSAAVSLDSVTVPPPVLVSVTVHVLVPPVPSVEGVHDTAPTVTAVAREIDAVRVPPFKAAVSVAVWSDAIVPAVAVKLAVVDPAPTNSDPGTVSTAVLLDSVTVPPPVFVSVTVHVLVPPAPSVEGVHDTALTVTGLAREIDAVRVPPFKAAVKVAVWSDAIVPAVAVKLAVVDPAPTATDPGTVSAAVSLDSVTVPPPVFVKVTVHVLVPPVPSVEGVQLNPAKVGSAGAVTVPPVPLMAIACPSSVAPSVFVTPMVVLATPAAMVTVTTATTPFCIREEFKPASRHRYVPELEEQLIDFPAVTAVPAASAVRETTSVAE